MPAARLRGLIAALVAMLLFLAAAPSHAQDTVPDQETGLVAEQQAALEALQARTDELERDIAEHAGSDELLVDIRLKLEAVLAELLESGLAFRPRLAEINARLEQLGAPPAEGQPPEPEAVAQERAALAAEKGQINVALGLAESLSIRVNGLINRIAELRRQLFQTLLTERYNIDAGLLREVVSAARTETADFWRRISGWLRFALAQKLRSLLAAGLLAAVAAVLLMVGGRRVFSQFLDTSDPHPTYLKRLSVALWSTLLPTAGLSVFLAATYYFFDYFAVLRGDIGLMLQPLLHVAGTVFFVYRLSRAALAPPNPEWRLIPVRPAAARPLVALITATGLLSGLDYALNRIYVVLGSPLALTVGESLVATLLIGVLVMLIGYLKPFADQAGQARPWPLALRGLHYLVGGVTVVAALLGYLGFARFLSSQIVLTGAIVATMYIAFLAARAIGEEGAFADTGLGRRLAGRFRTEEPTLDQLGLVASVALNLAILAVGVPLILFRWGFQPGDIQTWLLRVATGFRVGSITVSLTGILTGLIVFLVGYFATRWFQGWLDGSVMARGRVDAGVRNSIRLAVGYAGIALAAVVAISAAGIDLSNLALVAGALSLGIGFGLQNVVSNFVSGLILLAERPFKVGDWIVAGSASGTVRKISVRATEIETFQRQSVILPNSELINGPVANWTHRNRIGRIDIKVGVAYGTDAKRAHALMLDIARAHPLVLKNPEPFVLFTGFGAAAVEFEIRVFVADVMSQNAVQNDIRFAVLDAYNRGEIDIPSAARAPDPRPLAVPAEAETAVIAAAKPEPSAGPAKRRRTRRPDPE